MTLEPPLPLTPIAQAVEIGPAVGLVEDSDGGRVFLYGVLAYAWDAGDEALRRLAAVQMVKLGLGRPGQVAAGFGVDTATLWRWRQHSSFRGAGALVPGKRGPRGPSRLRQEVISQIHSRRDQGASLRQIGAELDLSASTVRVGLQAAPDTDSEAEERPVADHRGSEESQAELDAAQDGEDDDAARDGEDDVSGQPVVAAGGEDSRPVVAGAVAGEEHELEVLAQPSRRGAERAAARAGLLDHAAPVFTPAARVPVAGLLAALPGLEATGLLDSATEIYQKLPNGFYGLETVLLEAVFQTLAGAPRAEGAGGFAPTDLGRVLGMDRAPEVKTIRRKLSQLASQDQAGQLLAAMAARHLKQQENGGQDETSLVLYIDGHVRAYQGTRKIGKTHSPRLRFPAPATVETWISDAAGDPVLVVMADPGASLAMEIRRLLPDLREAIGDQRRVLVGFDRGGWSPALFADMKAEGFDVLTWRKGPTDDIPIEEFTEVSFIDESGLDHHWALAETQVELPIKDNEPIRMRQVTRLEVNKTAKKAGKDTLQPRQVHILTTSENLTAAEVVYRMGSRWRQENYFRYGRMHLDLDSHDNYAATADDPDRMVPNPAKREAHKRVKAAAGRAEHEQATATAGLLAARTPATGETQVLITSSDHNQITEKWRAAAEELQTATVEHALTPARIALGELSPDQQVLDTETKLLTHAIKIAAFNTSTAIARAIRVHTSYARANDEAYTLARKVLTHTGDIDPRTDGELTIRLDPMPTRRETAAVVELCEHLTAARTTFPGTNRLLRYQIKYQL